ncbi:hypothetical protein E2C01_011456 [Portunus trituberculatus]|uniref:Uncharacterized protein n=1 Tax=Portunus trituberculatus TaxID=210409 RepID=A0A5B7DB30_PORTR|nr:hypothetical protein [Portunus trituberculatus]
MMEIKKQAGSSSLLEEELDRIGVYKRKKKALCSEAAGGAEACSYQDQQSSYIEDSKECNIQAVCKRLKTVGHKREFNETKSFSFHPIQ